ncbi:MAG: alpha/beta fold hydrolase [Desulfobacterales bacterium]|jgi:esterase/lipase/1-acyl-sn-glycerol-3-phosphate acyltransferase|nr:alpha/beta fold hydrolase [Desulfobacterales bacterium]
MNRFAYRTTGLAIKAIYNLSKADLVIHGRENIPENRPIIFVINHFTRIETFLMPYYIFKLTNRAVWSLADAGLFGGAFGDFLKSVGAVSTKDPQRDQLIVKTLLTGEAHWIIFPEGRMVKNKKIVEKGRYIVSYAGGKRPPHTGAATLALRTEFYRQRLFSLQQQDLAEADRLLGEFHISSIDQIQHGSTCIVPVNITYYPVRAKENILSKLAVNLAGKDIPERVVEEIMTEGAMLLSGVDIDIRFAPAIEISPFMHSKVTKKDINQKASFGFDSPIASRKRMRRDALKIMKRYMDAIYSMTTVNSDHLFAGMLRQLPFRKTTEANLRRRVFLLASDLSDHASICLHRTLSEDQLHLITDDRYHRFRDFMSVATEKGVVLNRDGLLWRDTQKLSFPFDFHRVRIDNPMAVMANSIEPMWGLQKKIRHIAWLPEYFLRRRIITSLLKKELDGFEKDYAAFFIAGESKDKNVGRPFLLRGKSRKTGVLLIHGYMAAPAEVRGLAHYLKKRGYCVYAPRLKGHGTSPEDLAQRNFKDWIRNADVGYAIIQNMCRRVVVGGFSTGAGLALNLAARMPDIQSAFAVCPPMRLQDFSSKFAPAVDTWNRLMKKIQMNGGQKIFVPNHSENPHINYRRNPISGVRELERLMYSLAPKLPEIKCRTLVVQADQDPVVDPRGSRRLFEQLGATNKTYSLLNFSRHGILMGDGSERVYEVILNFIG